MPAVLLELGFMDSSTDVPVILTEKYADQCAKAIVEVLVNKGKLTKKKTENATSYRVRVTVDALNIRDGAGVGHKVNGAITDKGVYTIVKTKGNWGLLKSNAGWICLDYTKKV